MVVPLQGKKMRLLCIDGGETAGIVAGAALVHLEDQIQAKTTDSNARISDFFDIVVGTGTGGLLAAMVITDKTQGGRSSLLEKPLISYRKIRRTCSSPAFRGRRRFSGRSMEGALMKAFTRKNDGKVLTLKDTCKPLLVLCFDLKSSTPFVFSQADASESPSFDFELWKVIRATSATPSMFKPFKLASCDGKTSCLAVDGGLVMNNPTAAAITHVLHNKRDFLFVSGVDDLFVLSVGNGNSSTPVGRCSTVSVVVGIVLDGVSKTIDQLLGNAFCWNPNDYIRIQTNSVAVDVLTEKGVESFSFGGKRLLTETNAERIRGLVQRLVKTSLPSSPCKEKPVSTPLVKGR